MPVLSPNELDQKLSEVVARLRETFAPAAIYLFGSYAEGTALSHSDLDLLVIVNESDMDPYERDAQAYLALCGLGIPKDVQIYTRQEWDDQASLPGSLVRAVKTRGRLIYGA